MKKKRFLEHWQYIMVILVAYDLAAIMAAYFIALWLRFDCRFSQIPKEYFIRYMRSILIYAVCCVIVFRLLKLYRSIWRFVSYIELYRMILATIITGGIHILLMWLVFGCMPISYYIFGLALQFIFTIGIRFSYRFVLLFRSENSARRKEAKRVMLIGAGQAGQAILRDIHRSKEINEEVFCIIDDNPNKWNRYIDGVKVVGGRDRIIKSCEKYKINQIYYAIPSANLKTEKEILNICGETHCKIKKLPGMYQLMNGEVTLADMKEVQIEDLLGREPIKIDLDEIFRSITDKVILVTGGGGSIGSELCRQIAAHRPKHLIICDVYENNAYDIQFEIRKNYPEIRLSTIICSVRDGDKMAEIMDLYHPDIVYHAAAHKHVPLMEDAPCEAIKNNVLGTFKTAIAAAASGCKRFVLISTDKAVNPTNIMGASKRLCEMVIQTLDASIKEGNIERLVKLYENTVEHSAGNAERGAVRNSAGDAAGVTDNACGVGVTECGKTVAALAQKLKNTKTEFVAVRFGNVLGSNGSVIPLFKKQIEAGGPVTVTHPDIIRYFMTIPEAVSLVLQASVYARGGEIFIFDMGEPVKIDTLARNLIRLSGHEPDVDIKIVYTGLRPGEKLYEEKLMAEEGLKKTKNKLIHIGAPIAFDMDCFAEQIKYLSQAAYHNDEEIREIVKGIVRTYHPGENGESEKV